MAKVRARVLKSGRKVWQVDYRDAKGKRRAKQFPRQSDANAYLTTVRYDLQRGVHVAPGDSPTIGDAGAIWIERCERDRLVPSTLRQYRQHLRDHIEPYFGNGREKLANVSTPRVNEFVDWLLEKNSRALSRKVLTSLHSIFQDSISRGRATNNPCHGVKIKKTNVEETEGDQVEMPSKDDLRAIVTGSQGRWRPIMVTAMFTGMRGSELRGLLWEDVDMKAGIIHVRRRVDAWNNFGAPKSKAGKRDIPLAPIVLNTLREYRLACPKGLSNPLDLVFPSPSGRVWAHACILKDGFAPIQVAAGIVRYEDGKGEQGEPIKVAKAKYGLHALRHAAAALFIEQGMSPKRVQTIMGHASIKITFDLYGYLFRSDDEDREAMAQIEARLLP